MPQVSVLMTVYNGMPFLRHAVDSILNQTVSDFRFIIVDDGSEDGTSAYLRGLGDSRIEIVTQENQGTAAAANRGLKLVNTPFVARMDADDIALPDRLEKQLQFMQDHPDVGIVGTQVAPVGESSVGKSLQLPTDHAEIFSSMMTGKHGLAHSSIMIRHSVLSSVGGYWSLPLIDDWDMMLRMGEVSQLANLEDVGLYYRVHSGSLNGSSMLRMHRHIGYAIECAQRRQNREPKLTFEEFEASLARRPKWKIWAEKSHVYAMAQYRLAIAEIHGKRKLLGYSRLIWSAACSPPRTIQRIGRILKRKKNTTPSGNQRLLQTQ